jgi:HEAT repeat protein
VLKRDDLQHSLAVLRQDTKDFAGNILLDAISYRASDPEFATRLDGSLSPTSFKPPTIGSRSVLGRHTSCVIPRVVIVCFGQEGFPLIAESLLFSGVMEPLAAMQTAVGMHEPRAVDVLLNKLDDDKPVIRAAAIFNLVKMLDSLDAEKIDVGGGLDDLIGLGVPAHLQKLAKARELPEVKLEEHRTKGIWEHLIKSLFDSDEQVRSMIVYALQRGGQSPVPALVSLFAKEESPWVRAWCAVTLQVIGSEEASKALDAAKKTEKNPEVLQVIEGKAKPLAPWNGVPKESILEANK